MTNNKIWNLVIVIIAVFLLSFIYALIDHYPIYSSSYDIGKSTGLVFKQMIKILGMLGLIILVIRFYKK